MNQQKAIRFSLLLLRVVAGLFCFLFLFFAAYGAGEDSLDAILARRRVSKA